MNPDTSEFLDGYDRWYKGLQPAGGMAEREKLQGGKMKGWQKFRKKPIIIEAYQTDKEMIVETLSGKVTAGIGWWIIKGVAGEFYPCKPDIFEKTYELVEEAR